MAKPFFYRITSADLLNFATDPEGEGMSLLRFAKELQRGESDIEFIQSIIDEAKEFSAKKSRAAKVRWDAVHSDEDAPHSTSMPETVTEAEAEQKDKTVTKRKRFSPPTQKEVEEYCLSRNNGVNHIKWFNHYTANGWKVGKNKMKDWKAAVRTWEESKPSQQQGSSFDDWHE